MERYAILASQQAKYVEGENNDNPTSDDREWGIFTLNSQLEATYPSINVELKINDTEIVTELDTSASLTIISEETQKQKLQDLQIQPSVVTLKTYSGEQWCLGKHKQRLLTKHKRWS